MCFIAYLAFIMYLFVAFVGLQNFLAQADAFGGGFHQFVVVDEFERLFERKHQRRHKARGESIVVWRDGKIVTLGPDEIEIPEGERSA